MMTERNFRRWVVIAVLAAALIWLVPDWWSRWRAQRADEVAPADTASANPTVGVVLNGDNQGEEVDMSEALLMMDIEEGDGAQAQAGDRVSVHYTGTLLDGTKFDSSLDRGVPFEFTLGAGEVIEGWDQGVAGMKVGGKRQLTIPPNLGYGDRAVGSIPAGSTLVFEVELLDIL